MASDLALEKSWRDRIAECRQSGQSVKAWCEQKGLKSSAYYYWVKKIKVSEKEEAVDNSSPFAEVILLRESKISSLEIQPSKAELSLSFGKFSIGIPNGFDPVTLAEIVRVLQKL